MKTTVNVNIDAAKIVKSLGLGASVGANAGAGANAQKFFAQNVARHSDKYVPFGKGTLKNNIEYVNGYTGIKYVSPYARFQYYGKVMADPETGSSWARRGVRKTLTAKDIKYGNSALRGAFWERKMWAADGETVLLELKRFILSRPGGKA